MVVLYQFSGAWGLPSLSAFCLKVERYLRMVGLPYESRPGNLRKAPKGKLPYIDDEGTIVADSAFIIEHLKRRYGDPLDEKLSAEQRALGHAVRRMLEEGTYFAVLWSRWADPANWPGFTEVVRPLMPPVIGPVLVPLVRSSVIKAIKAQSTGRHSPDEIYQLGAQDLEALAALLGDKPFQDIPERGWL